MILGTIRVIFGFVLACLAAGAVKVAFAVTPAELAQASPDRLWQAGEWALLAATETAVFAAPFALIAVLLAIYDGKTPREVLNADAAEIFKRLELDRHLSSQRKNGLSGMVTRLRQLAAAAIVDLDQQAN